MKKVLFIILFTMSFISQAKVWEATQVWDDAAEKSWQTWIKSTSVQKDFFTKAGPWQGLKLDCADTLYALRIIFAYENKLPFKIASGASHQSTVVDKYASGLARVRAFINYVSDNNDAYALATSDTYPIKINDIISGDLYVTEWVLNNKAVRHSHLVKDVSPFGYFHLLYGTTPAQSRVMNEILGFPLTTIQGAPWGFRRFFKPQEYGKTPKLASNEQYDILKRVGPDGFFDEIQKMLEQVHEGIGNRIDRQMKNLCGLLSSRADLVQEAITFVEQKNGRCVSADEFNLYSTTARDSRLASGIKMLIHDWQKLTTEGGFHEASLSYQMAMDYLTEMDRSEYARVQLSNICSVNYGGASNMDVKTFFDLYQEKKISAHPNDSLLTRWGQDETKTNCPSYY